MRQCPYCGEALKKVESTDKVSTYSCNNKKCDSHGQEIHFMK